MSGVTYLARREIIRRHRTIVALTLFIAGSGATVLSMLAGARQTATSLERFKHVSRAADVELLVSGPSDDQLRRRRARSSDRRSSGPRDSRSRVQEPTTPSN